MNNIIVFLHHRAGSTVFQHLINHTPEFAGGEKLNGSSSFFPSIPPSVCKVKHVSIGHLKDEVKAVQGKQILLTHMGNWWGEVSSDKVPDPYSNPTFVKWGKDELAEFIPSNWKFYALFRDGRNIVESLRHLKGGIEERRMIENSFDYFVYLCKAFRNKARLALDAQASLPYKILKFEDMLKCPTSFMSSFANDNNLQIDLSEIKKCARSITKREIGKNHTSFKDDSKMNARWKSWSKEEVRIFKQIAGNELIELGYEANGEW